MPTTMIAATMPPLLSFLSELLELRGGCDRSGNAEHEVADQADQQDAVQDADEADVQPHVAVEDVAELVRDDALQFVARERFHRAARDADHGIGRRETGGERVHAGLVVHHVHGGTGMPEASAISSTTFSNRRSRQSVGRRRRAAGRRAFRRSLCRRSRASRSCKSCRRR